MSLLATRDLTIRFGGHVAVNNVTCAFEPGTLTAIVGPNGAGKTTYFNLISGQIDEVLNQQAFPTGATYRMGEEVVHRFDCQQGMNQTRVPNVDLWRLDQALTDVAGPR